MVSNEVFTPLAGIAAEGGGPVGKVLGQDWQRKEYLG